MSVLCQPLFPGESGVDQLVEIIKVMHLLHMSCHHVHYWHNVSFLYVSSIFSCAYLFFAADSRYPDKRRNQMHES